MTLGYISNFMNHHQKPVADKLYSMLGEDYRWIATTPVEEDRIKLGYDDLNRTQPYVICSYASDQEKKRAIDFCLSCDCLIVAYDFGDVVAERMRQGKMTVITSERICKRGNWDLLNPREYFSTLVHRTRYYQKPLYFLSIGDYAAQDYRMTLSFPGKCYRWGYFTEVFTENDPGSMKDRTYPIKIFWAARFIDWKHPEYMLYAAQKLKGDGFDFVMELAGNGPLFDEIQAQIAAEELSDQVKLLGAINHRAVREKMLKAPVFCLTSNRREGWGAVLGEALASHCITIASEAVGSASVLMNDESGVLFHDNDPEDFTNKLRDVLSCSEKYEPIAARGYEVMASLWNPKVASKRLICWIEAMLAGEETPFESGPCSFIR